jgi:hypothetical protein
VVYGHLTGRGEESKSRTRDDAPASACEEDVSRRASVWHSRGGWSQSRHALCANIWLLVLHKERILSPVTVQVYNSAWSMYIPLAQDRTSCSSLPKEAKKMLRKQLRPPRPRVHRHTGNGNTPSPFLANLISAYPPGGGRCLGIRPCSLLQACACACACARYRQRRSAPHLLCLPEHVKQHTGAVQCSTRKGTDGGNLLVWSSQTLAPHHRFLRTVR